VTTADGKTRDFFKLFGGTKSVETTLQISQAFEWKRRGVPVSTLIASTLAEHLPIV
jgi:hypothetical protein